MRFLITGSAGFIGFHLARRLLADGHVVTGFDSVNDYYNVALKQARTALLAAESNFRFIHGSLEDQAALRHAAEIGAPDIIVHLAAQAGVRHSIEAPKSYIDSNLVGSWAVLELARACRPQHLLLASTASVYGAAERQPFAEMDRTDHPLSLYAATKKSVEIMAHSYAHLFDVPTTCLRFFSVYGPWGRPDMALFKFVAAVLRGEPIDVYGHGRMTRNFTYVDDLVEAITRIAPVVPAEANRVAAIDTLSRVAPYRIVNISGDRTTPLLDLIAAIEDALGRTATLNLMDMQPGDVADTRCDPALLRALTGFTPATDIRYGVQRFVDWYRGYYSDQ